MISVVAKCGASGAPAGCWVCDSTKLSEYEVKNLVLFSWTTC